MVKARFAFQDIQGMTPAIDPRQAEGTTFVLEGRNFVVDSKGPRAAFASRIMNNGRPLSPSVQNTNVQALNGVVFTDVEAGKFAQTLEGDILWSKAFSYPTPLQTEHIWRRWTSGFAGDSFFFAHPGVGVRRMDLTAWVAVDPGIGAPQAVCETNGRLVVLGGTAVAWSSPGDPNDFTPTLGGAGFQVLSERVPGKPFALLPTPTGYIVWTPRGGLVGEFIGGDLSFRHFLLEHSHRPINDLAYVEMPDGAYLICTKQGLFSFRENETPVAATPVFNEYLRHRFMTLPDAAFRVRLDYDPESDFLYLQIRNQTAHFNETYVLTVAIDKWGMFNRNHVGIIRHDVATQPVKNPMGYVDTAGIAHRFLHYDDKRETSPGNFRGLDSEVVLGPIRVPELQRYHDVEQELQSFYLSTQARPAWSLENVERIDEDDSEVDVVIDEELSGDGFDPALQIPEDDGSIHMNLPETSYQVRVIADWSGLDPAGFIWWAETDPTASTAIETEPSLSHSQGFANYWTTLSPGIWHRVRIMAHERGEYFHITAGGFTFDYSGRLES